MLDKKRLMVLLANAVNVLEEQGLNKSGSFDNYLMDEIGFSEDELEQLKINDMIQGELKLYGFVFDQMLDAALHNGFNYVMGNNEITFMKNDENGTLINISIEGIHKDSHILEILNKLEISKENEKINNPENKVYEDLYNVMKNAYNNLSQSIEHAAEPNVEMNAGFTITNKVQLDNGFGVVLGEKKAAMKGYEYVTWIQNSRGYDNGYYFGDKKKALESMIDRAASLGGIDLREKFGNEYAEAEIETALKEFLSEHETSELMKNKEFMTEAFYQYDHKDRSYENEAFREIMEDVYKESIKNGEVFEPKFLKNLEGAYCEVTMMNGDVYQGNFGVGIYRNEFILTINNGSTFMHSGELNDIAKIRSEDVIMFEKGKDLYRIDAEFNNKTDEAKICAYSTDLKTAQEAAKNNILKICKEQGMDGEFYCDFQTEKNGIYLDHDEGFMSVDLHNQEVYFDLNDDINKGHSSIEDLLDLAVQQVKEEELQLEQKEKKVLKLNRKNDDLEK